MVSRNSADPGLCKLLFVVVLCNHTACCKLAAIVPYSTKPRLSVYIIFLNSGIPQCENNLGRH